MNCYVEQWGQPLAGEFPCGEDCCFSPELEALRVEVDKDTSLHAVAGTDWVIVQRLASDFLNTRSKDLWALAYVVYAAYRVDGLDACPSAFAALSQLLQTYWDSLYPSPARMQRRLAPLAWLCSRMEHSAETTCFMDASPESLSAFQAECTKLQAILDAKAGDGAPSFPGIFAKIPTATLQEAEPEAPPAQPPSRSSTPQPIAVTLAEMDKDGRVPAGVLPQLVRNVIENARQLAGHFLSMNATDERGYQLNRAALWSTLQQLPQTDAAGKTQLTSGVPADKMQAYLAAVDGKQYAEILPPLERSAGKAPFWLDGHFMVVRCLEGLEAHVAASVVREALAALLKRFPELLSYKFKDNTPFASARVLPWLETLCAPTPVGSFAPGVNPGAFGPEGSEEETRLQEALACNTEKDFQSGLRRLGTVPAGRSRAAVLHGVIQARYCLMAGRKKAATQLLSAVYLQMEQWNMLDWEPELTGRILALLLSSQPQQRGGATEDMLRRLHWFNLDTALSVSQEA